MSLLTITRVLLLALLVTWSFLDYGFVRGSYGAILPGFWNLLVILILTVFLMIPSVVFLPLWVLPQLLQRWQGSIRKSKNCCHDCGHPLEGSAGICPECGPLQVRVNTLDRSLLISCLMIWAGCWITGTLAGETIARLDEHQFIRSSEADSGESTSRERWKPYWGSLHWNQQSKTAFATLHDE